MKIPRTTRRPAPGRAAISLIAAMVLDGSALAEPLSLNPEDPKATEIVWKAEAELGEQVGRAEGVADQAGIRFFLSDLNVMSPLIIQVFAKDETKPIDVTLHRYMWRKTDLAGQTNEEGNWGYTGRVHDEVGIELRSDESSAFYILAWQGDAVKTEFGRTAFVSAGEGGSASAAGGSGIPRWMIGIVVVLLLFVAFLFGKLRSGKSAAVILLVMAAGLSPAGVRAEAVESRLASAEADIAEIRRIIREVEDKDRTSTDRLNARVDGLNARVDGLEGRADRSAENSNRIRRLDNLYRELSHNRTETNRIIATQLNTLHGQIASLRTLVEADRRAIPDTGHGGVSPMPSRCIDNPDCMRCSNAVNERLAGRLGNYERLRIIYESHVDFYSFAIDFGNSMSGWHQLEQAAWFREKIKMIDYQEELRSAYRAKFEEFNADLYSILTEFGRCEEQFGMENWFDRYGVLYYNSLISGYRLPEYRGGH